MIIEISPPLYYSSIYGIDNDIYRFCRLLCKEIEWRRYTNKLEHIVISPIIEPENGFWEEETTYDSINLRLDISKKINYINYKNSNIEERKKLIIINILESIESIKNKDIFNAEKFTKGFLEYVGYSREELNR